MPVSSRTVFISFNLKFILSIRSVERYGGKINRKFQLIGRRWHFHGDFVAE